MLWPCLQPCRILLKVFLVILATTKNLSPPFHTFDQGYADTISRQPLALLSVSSGNGGLAQAVGRGENRGKKVVWEGK